MTESLLKKLKILFVEDDAVDARSVIERLPDYSIDHCFTLKEARQKIRSTTGYDAVLCDLRLPDGCGCDLLLEVRKLQLNIAFVLLTGAGDTDHAIQAMRSGADDYLVKSTESLQFLSKSIENAISRFKQAKFHSLPIHILLLSADDAETKQMETHFRKYASFISFETITEISQMKAVLAENRIAFDALVLMLPMVDSRILVAAQEWQRYPNFDLPIVIITDHGNEEIVAQALRIGIADFLIKHNGYLFELPVVLRNVTSLKQLRKEREALEKSERKFRHLAENARDILYRFEFKPKKGFAYISPAITRLIGYTPEEFYADPLIGEKMIHPDDKEKLLLPRTEFHVPIVARWFTKNGTMIWTENESVGFFDEDGELIAIEGVIRDITERHTAKERLQYLVHHDHLTNLPNRVSLTQQMSRKIKAYGPGRKRLTLLLLDLDRFKIINESLGHRSGDLLLQSVADRLRNALHESDLLARFGGDEFAILIETENDLTAADYNAFSIIDLMQTPFYIEGGLVYVGVSIGMCSYPDGASDVDDLLRNAEAALSRAKEEGRNTYRIYTEDLTEKAQNRLEITTLLRSALASNELQVHYQPVVDLRSNEIYGSEALLRWTNPKRGSIRPDEFIPVAEETGLIAQIGEFVLLEACLAMRKMLEAKLPVHVIAVNVSPRQFHLQDLRRSVDRALRESGLPASYLELEITESALMHDPNQALRLLNELKELGIRFAIDDFGTGYSSLAHLKRYPIDVLKIDRSFIKDIPHDQEAMKMATTIIAMARGLELDIIAEGVESEDQKQFLVNEDCDFFQGFLCSPAVNIDDFIALARMQR